MALRSRTCVLKYVSMDVSEHTVSCVAPRSTRTYCLLCPDIGRIVSLRILPNYTASRYLAHQSAPLVLFLSQKNPTIILKSPLATKLLFLFHLRLDLPSRRFLGVKRQRLACFRLVSAVHEARPAASSVLKRHANTG